MIIPIELRFTADKDSKSAFRTDKTIKSHDVNSVEFHITIEGLELTDSYTAKILSVFHSSKRQVNVECKIVNGKIIYKPDTNLISRHEHVTNYVYVYHNNQSLDVREFIYTVDLSKIDETSLEVKEVYDQSYAGLLAEFEQALEDYKLTLPQADSVRAEIDVILNQFGVDSQAKLSQYDTDVQQVIADNQTAFGLAETGRQDSYEQAEDNRNQTSNQAVADWKQGADSLLETVEDNESARVDAEATRKTAETDRVSSETTRKTNETTRISNENARKSAEGNRQSTFEANEVGRQSEFEENELARESAESNRKANESDRVQAENERENAEEQRETDHANRSAELAGKADKVVIKNLVTNGDFSNGTTGWLINFGSLSATQNVASFTISEPNLTNRIYQIGFSVPNDIFYVTTKIKRTSGGKKNLILIGGVETKTRSDSVAGQYVTYKLREKLKDATSLSIYFRDTVAGEVINIKEILTINLTATFGAGNEPTEAEMDELIKVTGYIDGEYALNNKEMLIWTLALIRRNKNAIVTLGGA